MPKYAVVTTIEASASCYCQSFVSEAPDEGSAVDKVLKNVLLDSTSRVIKAFAVRYSEIIEWEVKPVPSPEWQRGYLIKNQWTR